MLRGLAIGEIKNDKAYDYCWIRVDSDGDVTLVADDDPALDGYEMAQFFGYAGDYRGHDCYDIGVGVWELDAPYRA